MDVDLVELPAGLSRMLPGPELAAVLATIDRSLLTGPQLAVVLSAQGRQVAHEQARLLADAVELGQIPWDCPGKITREQADEFSADQVAMTLTISRVGAGKMLDLGQTLLQRLPMVYEALSTGRIDYLRASAFSEGLAMLDDDTARYLATKLMDKAIGWTASQLRERIRHHANKADPDLAKRRYQQSVADRRVAFDLDHEGTAQLAGVNLPVDRAAAAEDRLNRLAKAAKADGDIRTMHQLRADAMLDILMGIAFRKHPGTDPCTAEADREAAAFATPDDDTPKPGTGTPEAGTPDASTTGVGTSGAEPGGTPNFPVTERAATHDDSPRYDTNGQAALNLGLCACGGVQPAQRRGVVDVVVKLSTLMFLDDEPGWIPGWGPVIADIARQIAFDQKTNPAWKWSATDEAGQLLHHGHTQRRPTAQEKAFVQARDRTCRAPGCRRRAIRCDVDHRWEHCKEGPSHRGNTCCLCKHHHRLKHEKGFTISPFGPAGFMWAAPDGRLYLRTGDGNLIAAADPLDDDDGIWDLDHALPPQPVTQINPAA